MDSLLRAATPALELAGVLLDDDRDHGQLTPSEIREAAEAALSELSLSPKVQTSRELSAASASDALLAVAALLDELALRDEGALAERWRRVALLQQRFLHPDLTTAGDRFFDRLEELLVAPRSAATLSVLRIYAICLELGFQGRYAAQDEGQPLIEARRRLALRLGTLAEPVAEARSHLASGKAPPRSRRRVLPALVALCLATAALSLGLAHHRLGRAIDDAQLHIDGHRQELIEVAR